jgi:hypothetical protein
VFCLEPQTGFCDHSLVSKSAGTFVLKNRFESSRCDYLYASIHLIFINAWRTAFPEKAEIVAEHFRKSIQMVMVVLGNPVLKAAISTCTSVNRKYETMFYIGPPAGIGPAWLTNLTAAALCFVNGICLEKALTARW